MSRKIFFIVGLVVALVLVFLWAEPRVRERFEPEPVAAWVGVEVEGSGVATVGPVRLPADESFRLHAILEARDRQGRPVYYGEAPALEIGGETIPAESLRRWQRADRVKLLWFSVEGTAPYVILDQEAGLNRVQFDAYYRPGFTSWSIDGFLDRRSDDALGEASGRLGFGTQRYQVWIEIFAPGNDLLAAERFKSWGPAELAAEAARFPSATVTVPRAEAASAVFGLTQVEIPDGSVELRQRIAPLVAGHLVFTRASVLRDIAREARVEYQDIVWQRAALDGGTPWGELSRGDLLRVGARAVVALEDRGREGVLDAEDWVLDFEQGAWRRTLGEIFVGEGELEWADLH